MLANAFLCDTQGKEPMSSRHLSGVGCYSGANLRRNGDVIDLDLAPHPYPPPTPHSHPGSLVGSAGLGKDSEVCLNGPFRSSIALSWANLTMEGKKRMGAGPMTHTQ